MGTPDLPLRSDAERNRERILAAARDVFATEGLGASMASVAREAEVGIATLFRRFPTKDDLLVAVFTDRMHDYADAAEAGLADADAWHGFVAFIEQSCRLQAADSGFADALTIAFPGAPELAQVRTRAYEATVQLITRAKDAGRLRDDFTPEDLVLLHMANAGVISATRDTAPDAWRRVTACLIQAYETPVTAPLPDAPTTRALYRAMLDPRRRTWSTGAAQADETGGSRRESAPR